MASVLPSLTTHPVLGRPCHHAMPMRGLQHLCSSSRRLPTSQAKWGVAASASRGIDLFDAPSLFDDLDQQMAQMQRSFQQMEQQMNDDVGRIMQRSSELKERGTTQGWIQGKDGTQTYRNEQGFEERLPGGFRRAYRSESITYFGGMPAHAQLPPQQAFGLGSIGLFVLAALFGTYASVAAAFWRNYKYTRYSWGKSWLVVGLWPVLALLSSSFRQELRTAIIRRSDTEPVRGTSNRDGSALQ